MASFGFTVGEYVNPPAPADLKTIVCDGTRRLLAIFGDPTNVTSGHAGTVVAMDVTFISSNSLVKVMDPAAGDHVEATHNELIQGTGAMDNPWVGYRIVYGISCSNPVAFVNDFRYENGMARWSVLHEWGTKEYVIEGCDSPDGEGEPLAFVGPGLSEHSIGVSTVGFSWVRLVEVEESGNRKPLAVCSTKQPGLADPRIQQDDTISRRRVEIEEKAKSRAEMQSATLSTIENPTCVVYTIPALAAVLRSEFADFWNARGHSILVVETPSLQDDSAREWVRASIRDYAADEGVRSFHLVSGWSDGYTSSLWSYSPYWQSKYLAYSDDPWFPTSPPDNTFKIPPFLTPDAERDEVNTARYHPYVYSDLPYADLDDDGVPDVVVTRWPFNEEADVAVACENMQLHNAEPAFSPSPDALLLGNELDAGGGEGAEIPPQVEELDELISTGWPGMDVEVIYRSEYPFVGDANAAVRAQMNNDRPSLVSILGVVSTVTGPGNFLFHDSPPVGWDMSQLSSGWFVGAVIAASCQSALWVPFDSSPSRLAFRSFLATPDRGTVSWIGPVVGGYQSEHFRVTRSLIEQICLNQYQSTAESWLAAMRTAYETTSDPRSLDAYAFLGNPISRFAGTPVSSIEAFVRKDGQPLSHYPNSETVAIGCPQGDMDELVINIKVEYSTVGPALTASEVIVSASPNPGMAVFPEQSHADATPELTWLGTKQVYEADVTIAAFSGCGEYSLPVTVRGIPFGHVRVRIKSPDVALSPESSRGAVILGDFAAFGTHSPSSMCDCVDTKPYSSCVDYAHPDTSVTLSDFALWGQHYTHTSGGSALLSMNPTGTGGSLRLELEEEQPLIGEHKLRAKVVLEDMHLMTTAIIGFENENASLRYLGWTPAPSFEGLALGSDLVRDGTRQVFIGVLANEPTSGDITIGTVEFAVDSGELVTVTEDDFELVTGDVLVAPSGQGPNSAQSYLLLGGRRVTLTPPKFESALAQNYPNPFNPTTTIAFSLARAVTTELRIYDVRGGLVRTLVNDRRDAGVHRVEWNGRDDGGQMVASGVYFCKLVAGRFTETKKMTVLK